MVARSDQTLAFRIAAMECARVLHWFAQGVEEVRIDHVATAAGLIALLTLYSVGELRAIAFRGHGDANALKLAEKLELRVRPELGDSAGAGR